MIYLFEFPKNLYPLTIDLYHKIEETLYIDKERLNKKEDRNGSKSKVKIREKLINHLTN